MSETTYILATTIPALLASITALTLAIIQRKHPDKVEEKVKSLLLPSQAALFDLSEEVFRARQDHTILAGKLDSVHSQITEVRADIATLCDRVEGTKPPIGRTTKGVKQ